MFFLFLVAPFSTGRAVSGFFLFYEKSETAIFHTVHLQFINRERGLKDSTDDSLARMNREPESMVQARAHDSVR